MHDGKHQVRVLFHLQENAKSYSNPFPYLRKKLSHSRVFAAVNASIVTPNRNQPIKGIVAIDVDMSPMGNPGIFKPHISGSEA